MTGKGEMFRRRDGKWAWRIKAPNGRIVATDGDQGYENRAAARRTLTKVITGEYDGPIEEID